MKTNPLYERSSPAKAPSRFLEQGRRIEFRTWLALFAGCLVGVFAPPGSAQNPPMTQNDFIAPAAVIASADGATLFVACEATAEVLAFDTASKRIAARIPVAPSPSGLALSADGSRLYVTCAGPTSTVCVVDTIKREVIHRL
ncbi:MAG: hypothetical protein O2960_24245, partial [Verrucomicrobia bacterium]|nr:hypothetical protein [Verrucomicrobiota bacterium]